MEQKDKTALFPRETTVGLGMVVMEVTVLSVSWVSIVPRPLETIALPAHKVNTEKRQANPRSPTVAKTALQEGGGIRQHWPT